MRRSVFFVLAAAVAGLVPRIAAADTVGPNRTYLMPTRDGRFVFVMIAPPPRFNRVLGEEETAEELTIRARYSKSGIYPAASSTPLWTVDWYSGAVEVASDGVHLIRYGDLPGNMHDQGLQLAPRALAQEALSFFADGRPLKTYSIGELVDAPNRLPQSVSHFQWCAAADFDDRNKRLVVETLDGNRIAFDVTTGELVSKTQMPTATKSGWNYVLIGVGAMLAATVVAIFYRRSRPNERPTHGSDTATSPSAGTP